MRTTVVIAMMALLLTACGGSDESSDLAPTDAPSSSASAEPTAAAAPASRPADAQTDAGAVAFSEFVVRTIVDTTAGAPVDDFLQLATSSCEGCITLAKQVGEQPEVVQKPDAPPTVSEASVVKTDGADRVVTQQVAIPAGSKIDTGDQSVVSTFDAKTYRFLVRVTWQDDRWFVEDYSVTEVS